LTRGRLRKERWEKVNKNEVWEEGLGGEVLSLRSGTKFPAEGVRVVGVTHVVLETTKGD